MDNGDPNETGAGSGTSPAFTRVVEQAREMAPIPRPVLIRGDRGTGKELVAHLFGHEKGAFTGAGDRRIGLFERADGGTLFLDEITRLSLTAQARLHRVVEYQTCQRVGGSAGRLRSRSTSGSSRRRTPGSNG